MLYGVAAVKEEEQVVLLHAVALAGWVAAGQRRPHQHLRGGGGAGQTRKPSAQLSTANHTCIKAIIRGYHHPRRALMTSTPIGGWRKWGAVSASPSCTGSKHIPTNR